MISFEQLQKLMLRYEPEIAFSVKGSEKFSFCWMGKMPDRVTKADVYWFGLTPDGNNAYDYSTFEEMSAAQVFDGSSLFERWNDVIILEIDACDPEERLQSYLDAMDRTD